MPRARAARVSISPSHVRCRAEGRNRRGKRIVNPFSKVGVRAAQDGEGAPRTLRPPKKKKKISMMVQYYAQTPDGKASHRATLRCKVRTEVAFLMAH